MADIPRRPSRAILRQWLARADEFGPQLDALPPDGPDGAVLIERLRFGPPETWRGWRAGFGAVVVKLWPPGAAPPPLRPVAHTGVARLLDQGDGWRLFAWVEGRRLLGETVTPELVAQVEEALAALHAAGQAHGDLTPANVVVGAGSAVLIDWGEDCAGTPGWRPDQPHNAMERDRFALARLRGLNARQSAATPAGCTPAAAPRCPPDRG